MAAFFEDDVMASEVLAANRKCFMDRDAPPAWGMFNTNNPSDDSVAPRLPELDTTTPGRPQIRRDEPGLAGLFEDDGDGEERAPSPQQQVLRARKPLAIIADTETALRELPSIQEVRGMLGIGSFGCVYRCTMALAEGVADVAVKVLRADVSLDHDREASLLAGLAHPNLVHLYSTIEGPPVRALILELCRGGTLQALLHSPANRPALAELGPVPRVRAVLDVVRAVEYLHANGVVHRDIKSGNSFLSEFASPELGVLPAVKLGDLGCARHVAPESAAGAACMTRCIGTVRYMAPEVISSHTYGLEADIFSCGILLHELVSGQVPFSGGVTSKEAALNAIVAGQRPSLDAVPGCATGAAVKQVLTTCWRGEPSERVAASELAVQLAALVDG